VYVKKKKIINIYYDLQLRKNDMMENRSGRNNNNIEQDRKKMYIKLIVLAILLHSAQSQTEFTCPAGTVSGNQKIQFKIF
jgi:hypothetical protein